MVIKHEHLFVKRLNDHNEGVSPIPQGKDKEYALLNLYPFLKDEVRK